LSLLRPIELVMVALEAAGCPPRSNAMRDDWQAVCPAHEDRSPSLQITQGSDGRVLLRCWAGCKTREILTALKLDWGHLFPDGKPYRDGSGRVPALAPRKRPPPFVPVPDMDLVDRVLTHALPNLRKPCAAPWLAKRGLDPETCERFAVGFMPWIRAKHWKAAMPTVWVMPITDGEGKVRALKLHRENPPQGFSKGLWFPVGTLPKDRPRHGWSTLWPPPESYAQDERLFLLPGELKALAVIRAGHNASGITAGESMRWGSETLARLRGRSVTLVYDDDDAGRKFRDETARALRPVVGALKAGTFGRKGGSHADSQGQGRSEERRG
jgi:hypothetical protein